MKKLKAALMELLGLFVDDWLFTMAIVAWLVVARLILPRALDDSLARGAVFVCGLLGILLERVWATSRRAKIDR